MVTSHTSILGTNQAAEIEIQPVKVSFIPKVNIRYVATMVMSTVKTLKHSHFCQCKASPGAIVRSKAWPSRMY